CAVRVRARTHRIDRRGHRARDREVDQSRAQRRPRTMPELSVLRVPLPEEPVGVGAKWEMRYALRDAGWENHSTELVVAREVSADRVVVDIDVRGHSTRRSIPRPVTEPYVESSEERGNGTITYWLDRMVSAASVTITTTTVISSYASGQTHKLQETTSRTVL